MHQLATRYSVFCPNALLKEVIPQFTIGDVINCEFWCQGVNDTYKITTKTNFFLLRIYHHHRRSLAEIQFELDALTHLHENGVDVAYPISTVNNDYIVTVIAPEGIRYAILTTYINGSEINTANKEHVSLYAHHMAQLHQGSLSFQSRHKRFELDVNHLIKKPLQRIKPFLTNRQEDWIFITNYAEKLTEQLHIALQQSTDIGFCHGDLSGGNAHLNASNISSFDFDCCGVGLRVYDLAVFKWAIKQENNNDEIWQHFLQSYQQKRPLAENDLTLIDVLVSIRQIWLMGLHIDIAVAKGWLNDLYFDQKIAFLRGQQKITYR